MLFGNSLARENTNPAFKMVLTLNPDNQIILVLVRLANGADFHGLGWKFRPEIEVLAMFAIGLIGHTRLSAPVNCDSIAIEPF